MLPECLVDFIGLRKCKTNLPTSGLYVDDLPGISTELLPAIAPDSKGWDGLWVAVQTSGYLDLLNKIRAQLSSRYDFKEISGRTQKLDRWKFGSTLIPPAPEYRGVYVEVPSSRISQLLVRTFQIYSNTIASTTFHIFDANEGTQIYTAPVDLVVGVNKIDLDITIDSDWQINRLYLAVDCTAIETWQTNNGFPWDWYCNQYAEWCSTCSCDMVMRCTNLPLTSEPISNNLYFGVIGNGTWADLQIECSIEKFFCQYKNRFAVALQHSMAVMLIQEKLTTFRSNHMAVNRDVDFQALLTTYTDKVNDMLPDLIRNMSPEDLGYCIDCGDKLSLQTKSLMA